MIRIFPVSTCLIADVQAGGSVESVKVGMAAALEEDRLARESARDAERAEVRKWKADQRAELDEMLPKATGRYACWMSASARYETFQLESPRLGTSLVECA